MTTIRTIEFVTLGLLISNIIWLLNYIKTLKIKNKTKTNGLVKEVNKYDDLLNLITNSVNPIGVFLFDDVGLNLVLCSRKWLDYYGTYDDFKKTHMQVYLKLLQYQQKIESTEISEYKASYLKEEIVFKNNKIYLKTYLTPWVNNRKIIGVLVEGIDITDCITNKIQKDSLDGINSTILSITAHQLKNRVRKLYLAMENRAYYSDVTPCGSCTIYRVVKDLDGLIDDLVSLGGIYQVIKSNTESEIKVSDFLDNVIKLSDYKEEQVTIEIEGGEEIEVRNRRLLEDVFLELLLNAWKYQDELKEPKIVIKVVIKDRLNYVFKIRDNGIGIEEKELKFIQKPYVRGAALEGIPGTGLGLVFTKLALEAMDMSFSIESKVKEYTEILVMRKNG